MTSTSRKKRVRQRMEDEGISYRKALQQDTAENPPTIWIVSTSACCGEHDDIDSVWANKIQANERQTEVIADLSIEAVHGDLSDDPERRANQVNIRAWTLGEITPEPPS